MIGIDNRVSDIRTMFKNITPDPNTGMLEIVNASFIADEPAIFGTVNEDWNKRELFWYLTQSRNVLDIPSPIPKVWLNVAAADGRINSNYGWCVFSTENGRQFSCAIATLKRDKHSRQAALIYNRPSMHTDATVNGMKDFMCTYAQQLLIRDDKLYLTVLQRSMDAIYGYKGDFSWANYLLDEALKELQPTYPQLTKGSIIWNAMSLHVYPMHHHLVV